MTISHLCSSFPRERAAHCRVANKSTDHINRCLITGWSPGHQLHGPRELAFKGGMLLPFSAASPSPGQGFTPLHQGEQCQPSLGQDLASFCLWTFPSILWRLGTGGQNLQGPGHRAHRESWFRGRTGKPGGEEVEEKGKRKLYLPCVSPFTPLTSLSPRQRACLLQSLFYRAKVLGVGVNG